MVQQSRAVFDHVTMCLAAQVFEEKTIATNFTLVHLPGRSNSKAASCVLADYRSRNATEMLLELANRIEQRDDPARGRTALEKE